MSIHQLMLLAAPPCKLAQHSLQCTRHMCQDGHSSLGQQVSMSCKTCSKVLAHVCLWLFLMLLGC
jgi:hypothetical protein